MKKKIIGIVCVSLGSILLSILLAFGVFTFIKNRNVATTGNVLGVSWYNETDKSFTISTVEELYEVAELAKFYKFKGQTIKLAADLVVNEGNAEDWAENAPSKKWKPINGFAGTFDGQGHTISGLYAKVFGSPLALFTNTDQSCTIKNLRLVNTYFEASGLDSLASFVGTGGGKFYQLYSDAILECKGEKVAGLASRIQKASKFEECWYDGSIHSTSRDVGGLIDEIYNARVEMKHCLFSGTIEQDYTVGGTRTGGICGRIREKASLIMDDCLSTGKIIADKTVYSGALLGVVYSGGQIKTTDCFVSSDVYHLLIGESGEQGSIDGRPLQMSGDMLIGTKAYEWTTLNFDKYWAAVEGDTPILRCFGEQGMSLEGVEKAFDVSWYTPGNYIYELTTLKQLYGLYILSGGNNFAEHTIKLGADIVVNEGKASDWEKNAPENPWFAINKFNGIFDGQGHSISGVYLKNQMTYQGFFAQVEPAGIVRNFSLKNSYFCNDSDGKLAMLGSIAGEFRGKLENVYSNAIVTSSGTQAGGIFGRTNDNDDDGKEDKVVITNCWFDGELRMKGQGGRYGGGFVGLVVQGDLDVSHCLNTGHISAEAVNIGVHVGGFVGSTWNKGVLNMNDCLSAGTMDVAYTVCVGSVLGRSEAETRTVNLSNVYATKECFNVTFFGTGEGGATTAKVNGVAIMIPGKLVTGFKAYEWTYLDFAEHWAIVKEGTPILRAFAGSTPSTAGYTKKTNFDWYKADKTTYTIKTAEEFYGFALLSCSDTFKGKTIQLGADIAVNAGDAATYATNVPELEWIPIGSPSAYFMGTFDGQGHTISGLYLNTEETYGGLFAMTAEGSVVKNFRLTNSYFCYSGKSSAILGSVVGDMYSASTLENVYSNATVVSHGHQVGGLVGRVNDSDAETDKTTDKAIIRNCWFDGNLSLKGETTVYGGGIVGYLFRGDLDMSHCLNTGNLSTEATGRALQFGGLIGSAYDYGTLNLTDCLSTGILDVNYGIGVGSVIGRVSCAKQDQRIVNITDTYVLADSYEVPVGTSATTAKINGAPAPLKEKFLTGYTAYQWTSLDFADNWAVVEGNTPVLQKFATSVPSVAGQKKMINLDWYNLDDKEYEIKTADQLRGFAVLASGNTFKGKTVLLKDNIDLKEEQWIPIGSTSASFTGTFDGQGKTISSLKFDTKEFYGGLFGIVGSGSVVKNFRLTESDVTYSGTGAAILGSVVADVYGGATLENIYSSATVVSSGQQAGGMVGRVNDNDEDKKKDKVVISNCWYDGQFSLTGETTTYGGGIVGYLFRGDLDMSNCLNAGSLSSEATGRALHFGGLIGSVNASGTLNLTDSLSSGILNVKHDIGVGSVIGRISCSDQDDRTVNITDTYAVAESYEIPLGTSSATAKIKGAPVPLKEKFLTGYTAYQWTTLDFADNWAVADGDTPVLQTFTTSVPSVAGQKKMINLDWYNQDAKEYEIKTAEQLRGFAVLASGNTFKGKTILLKRNIDLKEEQWLPIGSTSAYFMGTFDGQGKTISGLKYDTKEYYGGLFGIAGEGSLVKNFRLTESDVTYSGTGAAILGSVVADVYGGATLENIYSSATVVSSGQQAGGMVGRVNDNDEDKKKDKVVISNCWYDGQFSLTGETTTYGGGIVGYLFRGDLDMSNCLNAGSLSSEATERALHLGGLIGSVNASGTLNLTDSLSSGILNVKHDIGVGSVIGRVSTDDPETRTVNIERAYALTDSYKIPVGKSTQYRSHGAVTPMSKTILTGYTAYQWTELDFEDHWAVVKDGTPVLQTFATKVPSLFGYSKLFDLDWYDADDTEFEIKTEKELRGLALLSAIDDFSEKTITLKANIDLKDKEWLPIGSSFKPFAGTFDGQMKTIEGVYLNTSEQTAGFFGEVAATGTVSNFYLTNSTFNSTCSPSTLNAANGAFFGSVVGINRGTVSKIYSNASVNAVHTQVGGIVGRTINDSSVKECWFDGEVNLTTTNGMNSGGVVGFAYVETGKTDVVFDIVDCLFTGKITTPATTGNSKWGIGIGGILGQTYGPVKFTLNIEDCVSAGIIDLTYTTGDADGAGTILGGIESVNPQVKFTNVYGTNECCEKAPRIYYLMSGVDASITGKGIMLDEADLRGTSGYKNTLLDFGENGAWVARKDEVPGLKAFSKNITATEDITNVVRPDRSWYKEEDTKQYIKDVADLFGFMQLMLEGNTFEGKEVYLAPESPDYVFELNQVDADTLNKWKAGSEVPENKWIGAGTTFAGTFDGQMHTISGVYLDTSAQTAGLFGEVLETGAVSNFYLKDSYFNSSYTVNDYSATKGAYFGSVVGVNRGTVSKVYSDAIVVSAHSQVGGIVGRAINTSSIRECWFDGEVQLTSKSHGRNSGGVVGYAYVESGKTDVVFDIVDCLFTGTITTPASSGANSAWGIGVGGILGQSYGPVDFTINIENCISAGTMDLTYTTGDADGAGVVIGGIETTRSQIKLTNVYGTNECCEKAPRIYYLKSDVAASITGKGIMFNKAELKGTSGYQNTLLDFEENGAWVARKDNVPGLKVFTKVLGETVDITNVEQNNWYNANEIVFGIGSASAMYAFSDYSQSYNFSGKKVVLTDDIDMNPGWTAPTDATTAVAGSPKSFVPIGNTKEFAGTFDGQKHTVQGIYCVESGQHYTGFFGQLGASGTVKNLAIKNSYFKQTGGCSFAGSVVAYSINGKIQNVYSEAVVITDGYKAGGICGRIEGTVDGCWFAGDVYSTKTTAAKVYIGGIVGCSRGGITNGKATRTTTITNCLNTGTIHYGASGSTNSVGIGGIFGADDDHIDLTMNNCVSIGQMDTPAVQGIGAVVGTLVSSTTSGGTTYYSVADITNCYGANDCIIGKTNRAVVQHIWKTDVTQTACAALPTSELKTNAIYNNTNIKLDYSNWIARTNDSPIPRVFIDWIIPKAETAEKPTTN